MSYWDSCPSEDAWYAPSMAYAGFDAWHRLLFGNVYTDRRCILFGVGCCRLVREHWDDPVVELAVNAAERFADTECVRRLEKDWVLEAEAHLVCSDPESADVYAEMLRARPNDRLRELSKTERLVVAVTRWPSWQFGSGCYHAAAHLAGLDFRSDDFSPHAPFSELLREVFPNPFRLVPFLSSWRTSTVVAVARVMYESRDFSAMPILADALQDAGCEEEEILTHCRDARRCHVRGCWVTDLVLGKEHKQNESPPVNFQPRSGTSVL
ncbi:hypothetical protein VT84_33835 [Gemmata sp. SH-PL17]|uniref:hypothetical protein n=1 Tax=Gemmata sp. SH-PL17 TaxID=1630693 RepID=UPI00078DC06A|nr:hypothetical protein [Gemmata sp. SH-PL17]AMV29425.1 hypothetical protein VT84_33835 [Gemmata sp. SH-PL17]